MNKTSFLNRDVVLKILQKSATTGMAELDIRQMPTVEMNTSKRKPINIHKFPPICMTYHGACPSCGYSVNATENSMCCGRCGQMLIWEDETDG